MSSRADLSVLHVIPAVAARYGGPSVAVVGMCRALTARGVDVLLATTDADGPTRLDVRRDEVTSHLGVPTRFFRRLGRDPLQFAPRLAGWLRSNVARFDVVHVHAVFSHASLAACRAARGAGVPYVVRPLGTLDPWSLGQRRLRKRLALRTFVGALLRDAAAIHYTAPAERELAEQSLGPGRGVVVPLGVDVDALAREAASGEPTDACPDAGRGPYVLALGRIHPKKGLEPLVEAFQQLRGEGPAATRLLIAGDGEPAHVDALRRRVRDLGVEDRVRLVGWVAGWRKATLLRGARLLAMPSFQENFGLSLAEAMALGVPVLVSDRVNLAPEVAAAEAGWVVSPDPASILRGLVEAERDEAERRRRGQRGAALVERRFSWAAVGSQLEDLYRGLLP